jgi:hypothetical protein
MRFELADVLALERRVAEAKHERGTVSQLRQTAASLPGKRGIGLRARSGGRGRFAFSAIQGELLGPSRAK